MVDILTHVPTCIWNVNFMVRCSGSDRKRGGFGFSAQYVANTLALGTNGDERLRFVVWLVLMNPITGNSLDVKN